MADMQAEGAGHAQSPNDSESTRTVSLRLTFEEEHHCPQQRKLRDKRQEDHKRCRSPSRPASRKTRKTTTTAATPTYGHVHS